MLWLQEVITYLRSRTTRYQNLCDKIKTPNNITKKRVVLAICLEKQDLGGAKWLLWFLSCCTWWYPNDSTAMKSSWYPPPPPTSHEKFKIVWFEEIWVWKCFGNVFLCQHILAKMFHVFSKSCNIKVNRLLQFWIFQVILSIFNVI